MVAVLVGGRPGVRGDLVLVIARAHGQRVADHDPARRRVPRREEGVRAGLVDAGRRDVDTERAQPERAGLAIQQRAEHARRVEARHAQPVDRSIGRHQRAGVAVGEERVVGDRREGGWCSGALGRRPRLAGGAVVMTPPTARATRRGRRGGHSPRPGPTIPSRTVHGRGRVEQRLHHAPALLDAVLSLEALAVADHRGVKKHLVGRGALAALVGELHVQVDRSGFALSAR